MTIHVSSEQWRGREALRLSNGVLEVVTLPGGGHLAEMRLASGSEAGPNCLWAPAWPTADPGQATSLVDRYGAAPAGAFLAGFTGHALCLDLFGPPSPEEAALGIPLHGEAAVLPWSFQPVSDGCVGRAELPVSQLAFERRLTLAPHAPILYIEEVLENRGRQPRDVHWVQHLTLGPPLLAPNESQIDASLDHGQTWPLGYEGHEILPDEAPFAWPYAPTLEGSTLDLRNPFAHPGTGFIVAARISPEREIAFVSAFNSRLGLALVYCFRRRDFPWIAIWEENRARTTAPWNGAAQARGMEFGTTPMPVGREALRKMGSLLDTPSARNLGPGEKARARYLAALAHVPPDWRNISDVQVDSTGLRLMEARGSSLGIPAEGVAHFLAESEKQ